MHVNDLLKTAVQHGASDLHIKVGTFPMIRVRGSLTPVPEATRLTHEDAEAIMAAVVAGMGLYNGAVVALLVHAGAIAKLSAIGLWPAVVLHVGMTAWCLAILRSAR